MIYFVTGNEGKYGEAKDYIPGLQHYAPKQDLIEIQSLHPQEIIAHKLKHMRSALSVPYLVEDTSLHIHALGGFPGPYIKHMLEAMGTQGIAELMNTYEDRSVTAQCTVGYWDGVQEYYVQGSCKGSIIAYPDIDTNGFGWDPLFVPQGHTMSFSQMTQAQKKKISHRTQAMKKLADYISSQQST